MIYVVRHRNDIFWIQRWTMNKDGKSITADDVDVGKFADFEAACMIAKELAARFTFSFAAVCKSDDIPDLPVNTLELL